MTDPVPLPVPVAHPLPCAVSFSRWYVSRRVEGLLIGTAVTDAEAAALCTRIFGDDSPCSMSRRADGGWTIHGRDGTVDLVKVPFSDG